MSRFRAWLWAFLRHHRPASVGSLLVAVVLLAAAVGPLLVPYEPGQAFARYVEPSWKHWIGTDSQGYDLVARMVFGARTTLTIAIAAMVMSLVLGSLVGAVSGFAGGVTDMVLMRLVDVAMSFPSFLLAMVIVAILGRELENVVFAVGAVGSPMFARQVRAEILRVVSADYIVAARATGMSPKRILLAHAMPNSLGPIIVLGTLGMGSAILDVAGLNFLGLGGDGYRIQEWGLILTQGWKDRPKADLQVAVAGLAIFVTVLGFNLLGDGLKDELDPRTRRR